MKPQLDDNAIKLLREAAQYDAANPRFFYMNRWAQYFNPIEQAGLINPGKRHCGTTGCLLGTIAWLHDKPSFIELAQMDLDYTTKYVWDHLLPKYFPGLDDETYSSLMQLFLEYVDHVDSENVIEFVEIFIEEGLDGVNAWLGYALEPSPFHVD